MRGGEGLPHRHAQFGQPREALRHPLRRAAVPLALAEGPRPPAHRVPHARVLPRRRKRAPGDRRGRGCAENVQGRACAGRRAHLRPGGTRRLLRRRARKQAVSERRLGQPRAAARLHRAWHPRDLRRCRAPRERGRPFEKPPRRGEQLPRAHAGLRRDRRRKPASGIRPARELRLRPRRLPLRRDHPPHAPRRAQSAPHPEGRRERHPRAAAHPRAFVHRDNPPAQEKGREREDKRSESYRAVCRDPRVLREHAHNRACRLGPRSTNEKARPRASRPLSAEVHESRPSGQGGAHPEHLACVLPPDGSRLRKPRVANRPA